MRRPSKRMALVLALLAGVAAVAGKVRRGRDAALPVAPAPSTTWPPLAGSPTSGRAPTPSPVLEEPAPSPVREAAAPTSTRTPPTPAPRPEEPPADAPPAAAPPAPPPASLPDASPATAPEDAPFPAASGTTPLAPARPAPTGPPASTAPAAPPRPAPAIPRDEDDTDPRLDLGVPAADGDPSLEPEPEAVLPASRIDEAGERSALIADGDGAVPPAPEPTFGTAPDPIAAATAPVPVATPVEPEPDEPLTVPQRPTSGTDPAGTSSSGTDPAGIGASGTSSTGTAPVTGSAGPTGGGDQGDAARWIPPVAGACAPSHPVKAKLASRIFHLPGMVDYERTTPDRCYLDAAAAEADGLRAAKR